MQQHSVLGQRTYVLLTLPPVVHIELPCARCQLACWSTALGDGEHDIDVASEPDSEEVDIS